MDLLALTCWIRSVNHGNSFQVKISKTETVADLQEAIKNKKPVAFRDVDANSLTLYKPKDTLPRPYKENLTKFILSEHAEPLEGDYELSEVFPEPPLRPRIHIMVDTPTKIICWLRGATLDTSFPITIHPDEGIENFIPRIKDATPSLRNMDNDHIRLYMISGDENELQESLDKTGYGELLGGGALADYFLGVPVLAPLRVAVEVPCDSPTLVQQPNQVLIGHGSGLEKFKDIFLKVKNWNEFESSDIQRNRMVQAPDFDTFCPAFVTRFEKRLDRKPRLPKDLSAQFNPESYFEHSEGSTAEDGSQEEVREADRSEVVITTFYMASIEWEKFYGPRRVFYKQAAMDTMVFHPFLAANQTDDAMENKQWPIGVVVKREGEEEIRKYYPRSDFLIQKSCLPRLLVKVNSVARTEWLSDLVRMLTTGAFIVRFANKFVRTFQKKDFVLCAIYIWDNGDVSRYTLFQQHPTDEQVYYNTLDFSLTNKDGRFQFARNLYNLLHVELDSDQDRIANNAVLELNNVIASSHLKSMCTKDANAQGSRKRARKDSDDGRGRSGHDRGQLRAHGYEVKPEVIVDASGGEWASLSKRPDHILIVYRPTKQNEQYIAKKVSEESNELEIFKFLDTIPLKSDHVISLVDSFNGWAILPKMTTVQDYVDYRVVPEVFGSKISQVCLGVIKGVAYLHEHRIAHRDIKPENLVVDRDFNLKIIDFDMAMQVKVDDEEVDDQCGTRGWMAPEIENKLRHSPIKADRWACGEVILFLLDRFSKEDEPLRMFAMDLVAHNPEERPSLLAWSRYLVLSSSDDGNVGSGDARKTSQPRRERVDSEVNGENTKPPKKQRLGLGAYNMGGFEAYNGLGLGLYMDSELEIKT